MPAKTTKRAAKKKAAEAATVINIGDIDNLTLEPKVRPDYVWAIRGDNVLGVVPIVDPRLRVLNVTVNPAGQPLVWVVGPRDDG